jgi:hypothetical protein
LGDQVGLMVQSLDILHYDMWAYCGIRSIGEVLLKTVIRFVTLSLELQRVESVKGEVDPQSWPVLIELVRGRSMEARHRHTFEGAILFRKTDARMSGHRYWRRDLLLFERL